MLVMVMLTRRAAIELLLASGVGAVVGAAGHGYWYERHALQLVAVELPVAGLAPALDGVRIGFLTDLHHGSFVSQSAIAEAAALIMSKAPDLIVLGGDYVSHANRRYMRPCAEALASLRAPAGVFAVLGNHDDDRHMPAALSAQHFTVLRDAGTTIRLRGEPLELVGIRYWTQRASEIARLLKATGSTTILLAHDPRRLHQAVELAIPAVLSGHTHGGQIALPGLGAVAARKFPIAAGLAVRQSTSLFVSRGVGTVYLPIRIDCPPDVALVTLRAVEAGTDESRVGLGPFGQPQG